MIQKIFSHVQKYFLNGVYESEISMVKELVHNL